MDVISDGGIDRALGDRVALKMAILGVAPGALGTVKPTGAGGKFINVDELIAGSIVEKLTIRYRLPR